MESRCAPEKHPPPEEASAPHPAEHDHSHVSLAELRLASGRVLWTALVILSVFFLVELIGGYLANSLALISDAAHLLTDVAAVGLSLFAQWFSCRPASARRSFGLYRVEILAALANGFTLLVVAIFIGVEAYERLFAPPQVAGLLMVIIASLGLVAQVVTTLVLSRAKSASLNVRSAYLHAMTDAVQSVGVVGAGVVILVTGWQLIDPIISILIALLVAFSGGKIILEATHVLIEGTPAGIDLHKIVEAIQRVPGVLRVTDLHVWSLTTGLNHLSAHVVVEQAPEDLGNEALRRLIAHTLQHNFPLQHLTLQIERECELCKRLGCGEWLNGITPEDPRD